MPEIVKQNPVNEPTQKPVKTHSKFTPNYSLYATHQFGFNSPFFAMEGITDDDISLRTNIDTDTFTLKAPVMQPVRRAADYFQVPLRAILPRSAELIITNPLRGDDIDAYAANAVFNRTAYISRLRTAWNTYILPALANHANETQLGQHLGLLFRAIQVSSLFVSRGSLTNHLGTPLHTFFRYTLDGTRFKNFDIFVDNAISWVKSLFAENGYFDVDLLTLLPNGDTSYGVAGDSIRVFPNIEDVNVLGSSGITMRQFMELLYDSRPAGDVTIVTSSLSTYGATLPAFEFEVSSGVLAAPSVDIIIPQSTIQVNVLKLAAYQIACAEFYSSDKVDDVYSARLWHDNMDSLVNSIFLYQQNFLYVNINGVHHRLDPIAGDILNSSVILGYLSQLFSTTVDFTNWSSNVATFAYLANLFGFQRSLRYQDYFVGSRTRPLAVGDVTVGVDTGTNTVDVIDVSKKIQVQRFLNQVNRIGRKFSDYVKGIFGDKPMPDAHDPIFLGHVVDTIGAEETENTADAQYNTSSGITSKLRNNVNRFGFDVHVGEPSILIGILNYDLPRVYGSVTERENYHVDRYQMFNPYMQFVGDQEVLSDELFPGSSGNFGYQIRYAEYRQRVDRGVGGFGLVLPGYAKVYEYNQLRNIQSAGHVNSEFIRSHLFDIDEFYLSLTGFSLATYFHFIDRVDMSITARRPIAFAPSIL